MADLRRDFALPPDDVAFLEEMGWPWEAIRDGGTMWLLIHEYPVLDGYQINATSVALQLAVTCLLPETGLSGPTPTPTPTPLWRLGSQSNPGGSSGLFTPSTGLGLLVPRLL